jgi:hypothetical protein
MHQPKIQTASQTKHLRFRELHLLTKKLRLENQILQQQIGACTKAKFRVNIALASCGLGAIIHTAAKFQERFSKAKKDLQQQHTPDERSRAFIVILNSLKNESDEHEARMHNLLQKTLLRKNITGLEGDVISKMFDSRENLLAALLTAEKTIPGILYTTLSRFTRVFMVESDIDIDKLSSREESTVENDRNDLEIAIRSPNSSSEKKLASFKKLVEIDIAERLYTKRTEDFCRQLSQSVAIKNSLFALIAHIHETFPDYPELFDKVATLSGYDDVVSRLAFKSFGKILSSTGPLDWMKFETLWNIQAFSTNILLALGPQLVETLGCPNASQQLQQQFSLNGTERGNSLAIVESRLGIKYNTHGNF